MEKKILEAACNDRDASEVIRNLVSLSTLSDYAKTILEAVQEFYEIDPEAQSVDKELLVAQLKEKFPKNHGELTSVIQTLGDTSPANVVKDIVLLKRKDMAREIASLLISNPESAKIRDMYLEFEEVGATTIEETPSAADSVRGALTSLADKTQGIRLYPNALNDRLTVQARHGNHIIVFARPNVGKTAFIINLVRGLLRDGRRVLHFINEEPSEQVLKRIVSRITGMTTTDIDRNTDLAVERSKGLLENLYMKDLSPGTFGEIYSLTKEVKPDVVILDQLRNISVSEDNRVISLEKAAMAARNLGKELGCMVVSVTQAGDSARNKLILDDGDIDFSNTGIPATGDLIIGIGMNQDYRDRGRRVLTIVKNKLGSDHSNFPVRIDEELSKIVSL